VCRQRLEFFLSVAAVDAGVRADVHRRHRILIGDCIMEPLKNELHPAAQRRLEETPRSARRNYRLAITGEGPPRGAIKAKCLQCMGYDRKEIANCVSHDCALHAYRPFLTRKNES